MKKFDDLDRWFKNTKPAKKKEQPKKLTSSPSRSPNTFNKKSERAGVKHLIDIARRKPEVFFNLKSNTKSARQLKNHFLYVLRLEQFEDKGKEGCEYIIENQDGDLFSNKEDVLHLCEEWKSFGFPDRSEKRESFHFILSMPAGTDPVGELNAARDTIRELFSGHKYTLAQHLDEDHPHVHVCIMSLDEKGKRLNPRKADLQLYREVFAEKLQDYGIDAAATRRRQRFKYKRPENSKMQHMRKRGAKPKVYEKQSDELKRQIVASERPKNPAEEQVNINRETAAHIYLNAAEELMRDGREDEANLIKSYVIDGLKNDTRSVSQIRFDYANRQLELAKSKTKDNEKDL